MPKTQKPKEKPLAEKKLKKIAELETLEDAYIIFEKLSEKDRENLAQHYKEREEKENKKTLVGEIVKKAKSKKDLEVLLKKAMIESLEEEYRAIKEKMSVQRKGGKDTRIEEIELMRIPLKIKLFQATFGKKEYYAIKKVMHDIEQGLS